MNEINKQVENQYHRPYLFEDILNLLAQQGVDLNNVLRSDISGVDEFHVRGAEISKELVSEFNFNGLTVLDIGCGIGGPARRLADEFNCKVYGIDMSHEFIRTAQELSRLVKLDNQTEFVQGDALALPYKDASFDVVWTQHVQMNIENKNQLYSEVKRVLKNGGTFIYYDIFKKNNEDLNYPVPWANEPTVSFLQTIANMESSLKNLGFVKTKSTDQTAKGIAFLNNLVQKMNNEGPPKSGLNILIGNSTIEKMSNLLNALQGNKIELESGIYKK